MENQVNVISKQVEVLVMTNLTADKEYARVYFEPSNQLKLMVEVVQA